LNEKFLINGRAEITEINNAYGEELEGNLVIRDFPNLQKVSFSNNKKITSLKVSNCPQVEEIDIYGNEISRLEINELTNLKNLICSSNQLKKIDVVQNKNLKTLVCFNNTLEKLDRLENIYEMS